VIRQLRRLVLRRDGGGLTDGQLLEWFIARRDEAAFEALVRRHGPMVLGVCRRVLADWHDAEDAFQATFLVLARKAATLRRRELLGHWLYGVAYRTAREARAVRARRQARERQVEHMPEVMTDEPEVWHDLRPLLDQELSRLPAKYGVPVVLCDLEGRPRKEVARQLRIPEGTLSSRLATARKLLAARLARRGVTLTGGALATALGPEATAATVAAPLVAATVKAVMLSGSAAAAGVISAPVAALTEGVLRAMLLTKLKTALAVVVLAGVVGVGVQGFLHRTQAAEDPAGQTQNPKAAAAPAPVPMPPPNRLRLQKAVLDEVDVAGQTINVTLAADDLAPVRIKFHLFDKDVGVVPKDAIVSEVVIKQGEAVKPVILENVTKVDGQVVKVDEAVINLQGKLILTETVLGDGKLVKSVPVQGTRLTGVAVAKDVAITIGGKPAKLADLKKDMVITLELGIEGNRLVIRSIQAEK
jgi:RNA polymerase sigma factor (sigma-70 family)